MTAILLLLAIICIAACLVWSLRRRPLADMTAIPAEPMAPAEPSVSRIVEAAGSATSNTPLSARIEQAMSQAVLDAMSEGISDPAVIKARMLQARAQAKASI